MVRPLVATLLRYDRRLRLILGEVETAYTPTTGEALAYSIS